MEQVDRVIEYLARCGEPDIEAGIGALLGIGSEHRIRKFREELRRAIENVAPIQS